MDPAGAQPRRRGTLDCVHGLGARNGCKDGGCMVSEWVTVDGG